MARKPKRTERPGTVDIDGMRSMMNMLPLEQRLEASVALITFAVAAFGGVVLELGRNCPAGDSRRAAAPGASVAALGDDARPCGPCISPQLSYSSVTAAGLLPHEALKGLR